ncbi:MAG: PorV/PorQ family protein [Candidatus Neomarinimicrobiota bacterium]
MKRFLIPALWCLLVVGAANGQSSASAIFLLIAPGAAAGGTGEAHVAAAPDAYSSYWNPATLAFLQQNQVVYQYSPWLPGLANDIRYNFFGMGYNLPGIGTFGAHLIYLDLGEQIRTDENRNELGTFSSYMAAFTVGFGTQMSPTSSVGVNVKLIHQNLSNITTGAEGGKGVSTDIAFDFSYYRRHYPFRKFDFGLAVTNIGPKISFIDVDQADPQPTNLKLGFKWNLIESEFNRLSLVYDMNKLLVGSHPGIDLDGDLRIGGYDKNGNPDPGGGGEYNNKGKLEAAHTDPWYLALFTSWVDDWNFAGDVDINSDGEIQTEGDKVELGNAKNYTFQDELDTITHNVGVEYWYSSYFAIRAGLIYDKLGKIYNPTFGTGIHYGPYGFDFGYIYGEQGHPLTNTMRFSLNMSF